MYAAQSGNSDCVKALIAAGADLNAKNNRGMTILEAADSENVRAILRSAEARD
jgi:ankyrin repeat protein